jgi:hypothetical protein
MNYAWSTVPALRRAQEQGTWNPGATLFFLGPRSARAMCCEFSILRDSLQATLLLVGAALFLCRVFDEPFWATRVQGICPAPLQVSEGGKSEIADLHSALRRR